MSGISTGVGLISGLNITEIVDALIAAQRAPIVRMESRAKQFQTTQLGIQALEANLLSLNTTAQELAKSENFSARAVQNSDESSLRVTAGKETPTGTYQFQSVQVATSHSVLSRGFTGSDHTFTSGGTLRIASGGRLNEPKTVDLVNGGAGLRRGSIRITDRTGQSAVVNLSNAHTIDNVVSAINSSGLSVSARLANDRLVLSDTSGSTAFNLTVADVNGGHAAEDLGIRQSVASSNLNGSSIYYATDDFTLDLINDGNSLGNVTGLSDFRISYSGGQLEIDLDDAKTVGDVIDRINSHASNGGTLNAAVVNGRIELTDAGGGPITLEDINGASVVKGLGLGGTSAAGTLAGQRLTGGLDSVLLRNLFGGQGLTQLGAVSFTDRTGTTAVVDFSGAETLDDVIQAINSATDGLGNKLQITATIDDVGTGILIADTSGATASNLVIADQAGSTLAAQFGIAIDAAQTSIHSASLNHRHVSGHTRLDSYAPAGGAVAEGSFRITDGHGSSALVSVNSSVKTLDDLFTRIAATGLAVRAELNDTGDGFRLVSTGGAAAITVTESGSTTAADLRILGTGMDDGSGNSEIVSRQSVEITVEAGESLNDLLTKINESGAAVTASLFNDGSTLSPTRLALRSTQSGREGRLVIDDSGLGLNLATREEAQDALLRVGGDPASGFLLSSSDNTFDNAADGMSVEVLAPAAQATTIRVARDTDKIGQLLSSFVGTYNTLISTAAELTKFDPATNKRGVMQGDPLVLRTLSRMDAIVTGTVQMGDATLDSLLDLGVRIEEGGKLSLDEERLAELLASEPDAVADLFTKKNTGFAAKLEATLDSLTDRFTGTFTLQNKALQESIDSLNARIEQLDGILEGRRERLYRQFLRMEEALSLLQSHQQTLGGIKPISA